MAGTTFIIVFMILLFIPGMILFINGFIGIRAPKGKINILIIAIGFLMMFPFLAFLFIYVSSFIRM